MIRSSDLNGLRQRFFAVFWVIFDQGIFALANFTINVLFARWLTPVSYGWFSLSFSGCLLVMTLHSGAILEPMLVQSAQVAKCRRRSYVVSLANAHLILISAAVCLGALGYAAGVFWDNTELGSVIATGLLGGMVLSTLSTGRRLCGVFVSPRASGLIGSLYLVGSVATGFLLRAVATVEWLDIWLIVGTWALVASAATFWISYRQGRGNVRYGLSEVISFSSRFAHWGLVSSLIGWLRSDGLLMILAKFSGLGAVAETRAIFNIGAPLAQANMAAHISAIVWFSSDRRNSSKRAIWRLISLYAAGSALLIPMVYICANYIVELLYGGRYFSVSWQLWIYFLSLAMSGLDVIVSSASRAQGLMLRGYGSSLLAGTISIVLGLILIPKQHTVIYVIVISSAIGLAAAVAFRMIHCARRRQ